jgi:predicted DNA-binding transcriptional regulator AlpA
MMHDEIMTLEEAAGFLRVSRSTMYQRTDIPRHRMPGSRVFRYLRSELLAWLKGEMTGSAKTEDGQQATEREPPVLKLATENKAVYHRLARYR